MNIIEWIKFCHNEHDVVCNQKYGDKDLPYSFHLRAVNSQVNKFSNLLSGTQAITAIYGAAGHDLIEDARSTYNDIKMMVGEEVAEIIYLCTEDKGKNRNERHSDNFYSQLRTNELAVFVKMCDIIANVKYSLLMNSSMLAKYKSEYEKTSSLNIYLKLNPMFEYLKKLLEIE